MKSILKSLALGALFVAMAPLAKAAPITGSIGFGGNGSYSNSTGAFTAGPTIGTTGGNGYVNSPGTGTLTMFTQFNPASFSSFVASSGTNFGSGVQVFTSTEGGITLTFFLTSFTATDTTNSAGNGFTGTGFLRETGFTDTTASFSLNSNAGASTFVTFNTATTVTPEPNSLMLMGTGLVSAAGVLVRRRRLFV